VNSIFIKPAAPCPLDVSPSFCSRSSNFYSAPDRGAEYCVERVCLCVCVCVCALSVRGHVFGTARPIFTEFLRMLPAAVARSSCGGVMIRYVLPVL